MFVLDLGRSILCAPLRTIAGEEIGVSQILNKIDGEFEQEDLELLEAMTEQAAIAIQGNIIVEQIEAARKQELEFLMLFLKFPLNLNLPSTPKNHYHNLNHVRL